MKTRNDCSRCGAKVRSYDPRQRRYCAVCGPQMARPSSWTGQCKACDETYTLTGNDASQARHKGRARCPKCIDARTTEFKPGDIFGHLTVVSKAEHGWHCTCDCGNAVTKKSADLRRGNTKSCGCAQHKKPIDMTGYVVGFLRVIGQSDRANKKGERLWACLCTRCGGNYAATGHALRGGGTVSCGCANRERDMRAIKRVSATKYELHGVDLTLSELAEIAGVPDGHMRPTIKREGTAEKALSRLAHRIRQPYRTSASD